jgi:hypothetical protein
LVATGFGALRLFAQSDDDPGVGDELPKATLGAHDTSTVTTTPESTSLQATSTTPPPTTAQLTYAVRVPINGSPDPFVPPTVEQDGHQVASLVFTDGTEVAAWWPTEHDFASHGLYPITWARSTGQHHHSAEFFIRHGDINDLLDSFGNPELLGEYSNGRGGTVGHWRAKKPRGFHLVAFQFDSWSVVVLDDRMTDAARRLWATNLHGLETADGFLLLTGDEPLHVAGIDLPPSIKMHLFSASGEITLRPVACTPGFVQPINPNQDSASWCTEHGDLVVTVRGSSDYAAAVHDNLHLGPVTTP